MISVPLHLCRDLAPAGIPVTIIEFDPSPAIPASGEGVAEFDPSPALPTSGEGVAEFDPSPALPA
ncbi:MAG: hypothetical protein ACLQVD_06980, partial [Capsulimonadaceae bacterium]